jgi:hypothetical protein
MAQRARPSVTPTSPTSIDDTVSVRHYDELDDPAQQAVFSAVHGDGTDDPAALPAGNVVVFNGYHRVE